METFQKNVLTWLSAVEEKLGIRPIIYTNHPFGNEYLNNSAFSKYKLWIAAYGVDAPKIPDTWKEQGWTIWQKSQTGKEQGLTGDEDVDIFIGTMEQFNELVTK